MERKNRLITTRDAVALISAIAVVVTLVVGIIQLVETRKQLKQAIEANKTSTLVDLTGTYYDTRSRFYNSAETIPHMSKEEAGILAVEKWSALVQDYINSIGVFCDMRRHGRLNELGNDFVDKVIQDDTKSFLSIAKGQLGINVSGNICNL